MDLVTACPILPAMGRGSAGVPARPIAIRFVARSMMIYSFWVRLVRAGLTLAPLLGDMLAAEILGMPVTLACDIRRGLDPYRFRLRASRL